MRPRRSWLMRGCGWTFERALKSASMHSFALCSLFSDSCLARSRVRFKLRPPLSPLRVVRRWLRSLSSITEPLTRASSQRHDSPL